MKILYLKCFRRTHAKTLVKCQQDMHLSQACVFFMLKLVVPWYHHSMLLDLITLLLILKTLFHFNIISFYVKAMFLLMQGSDINANKNLNKVQDQHCDTD